MPSRAGQTSAGEQPRVLVEGMDEGRPMLLADAQIAGICIANAATLATRNVKGFANMVDLIVINPLDHPLF